MNVVCCLFSPIRCYLHRLMMSGELVKGNIMLWKGIMNSWREFC